MTSMLALLITRLLNDLGGGLPHSNSARFAHQQPGMPDGMADLCLGANTGPGAVRQTTG